VVREAPPVLLADIGGADARFALARGGTVEQTRQFQVADHAGPLEAIRAFPGEVEPRVGPRRAAPAAAIAAGTGLGVAGRTPGRPRPTVMAGGIVPRLTELLAASRFREGFDGKGRLAAHLGRGPAFVVVHPDPAFLGLAAPAGTD
jgi:glucokinase